MCRSRRKESAQLRPGRGGLRDGLHRRPGARGPAGGDRSAPSVPGLGRLGLVNWLYGFFVLPESLPPGGRDRFSWRKANPVGSLAVLGSYPLVAGLTAAFVFAVLAQRGLETVWVPLHRPPLRLGRADERLLADARRCDGRDRPGALVRPIVAPARRASRNPRGPRNRRRHLRWIWLATAGWVLLVFIVVGSIGGSPARQSRVSWPVRFRRRIRGRFRAGSPR